jgi:serine/threonine protein kinase
MAAVLQIGATLAGYTIESLLGRGGMGAVYLATHERLKRRVALKVLVPELADDEAFRERFIRESQLAASLDHPNVVPIYDADEHDGVLFIAMRYVEGPDLKQLLKERGPLSPRRALQILEQVAGALDAAHAAGLVHRDVKPANILIERPSGRVFLSDFGVAKRTSSAGLTKTGSFLGSVDYCSPEQINGEALDGRADVYALGCVAYHCLAGQPPFPKETEIAVVQAHLAAPPPALSNVRPGLPVALDGVLVTAMAKHREARYSSASAFAAALRVALGSETRLPSSSTSVGPPAAETVLAGSSVTSPLEQQPAPDTVLAVPHQLPSEPRAGRPWRPSRKQWLLGTAALALLALAAAALAIASLSGSHSRHTAGPVAARSQSARFDKQIADIVRPLVAPQQRVTIALEVVRPTTLSFSTLRATADSLERAVLRAQGVASLLAPGGDGEKKAKSALAFALDREDAYARALTDLSGPSALTTVRARAIRTLAGAVDSAFNQSLVASTGTPCCPAMPISRASAGPLVALAAQNKTPGSTTPTTTPPATPSTPTFQGSDFSIEYPAGWVIEAAETNHGSYLDTTIVSPDNPKLLLRIDESPTGGSGGVDAAAAPVIASLRHQHGYRQLLLSHVSFQGGDALEWEFVVLEGGILLHKIDLFFVGPSGSEWAILTQAPAALWPKFATGLDAQRQTFDATG